MARSRWIPLGAALPAALIALAGVPLLTSAGAAPRAAAAPAATSAPAPKPLVRPFKAPGFGRVLVSGSYQALYYWTPEKRKPGTIKCTGACAKLWPPLYVPKGRTVAPKVKGYAGRFGTIRRPDGRRQLTYNRLPLYAYAHEGPRQVLCDDVDGWFVIRV